MKINILFKLLLGFCAVLVLTAVVGLVGITSMGAINKESANIYNVQFIGLNDAQEANKSLVYVGRGLRQSLIFIDDPAMVAKQMKLVDDNIANMKTQFANLMPLMKTPEGQSLLADTKTKWQAYEDLALQVAAKIKVGDTAGAKLGLLNAVDVGQKTDDALKALVNRKLDNAKTDAENNTAIFESSRTILLSIIIAATLIGLAIAFSLARSLANAAKQIAGVATGVAKGELVHEITINSKDEMGEIAAAMSAMIAYLQVMAGTAEKIANADLTENVKPLSAKDVLGNAFLRMITSLRETVGQVTNEANALFAASEQLASAANQAGDATSQIASTIQQVAKGTQDQAQSVNRTAATVEGMSRAIEGVAKGAQEQAKAMSKASDVTGQLSRAIEQVAGNAAAVARDSDLASQAARSGATTVKETLQGMQSIKTKVGLSAEKVAEMGTRSGEIGAIVETIEDIASQTNLLALNAAIEAARAGEHGKGFAVVADEVRKLAERSSQATKEIGGLIKGIQKTVADAVQAMEDGSREVELGVAHANQAGEALAEILKAAEAVNTQAKLAGEASQRMSISSDELVSAVDSVSAVVEENIASTEEMAAGSGEVTQAIESIASVSEQNSAAVEQVSASAEEMSAQVEEVTASAQSLAEMAKTLQEIVSQFKLSGEDQAAVRTTSGNNGNSHHPVQSAPPGYSNNGKDTNKNVKIKTYIN